MIDINAIIQADKRIKSKPGLVYETPLSYSPAFSKLTGAKVWFKCEHLQQTGSFKLRGASNKILSLTPKKVAKGVITASSGNHGMGVALASRLSQINTTVYVPENASQIKLNTIQQLGAKVIKVKGDSLQAELEASRQAKISGKKFISPYNDHEIIAGQGTVGLEILNQEKEFHAVFVSVGGGGLISGIGSYIKQKSPHTDINACWPSNASAMYRCLEAGRIIDVDEQDTLSDGTAGGVEKDAITFPICQEVIDNKILVKEEEIRSAMKLMARQERFIIEGAAGVALGGFLKTAERYKGKKVAIVLCGRNILLEKFIKAIS
ncbi:MAG: threonine/serine dehydratase [Deltaproteobacteria bacterium]|nr:threonine/serine dehydratase [Deltaproteobacteria bacterium]